MGSMMEDLEKKKWVRLWATEVYPSTTYKIQKIDNMYTIGMFYIKILFLPITNTEISIIEVFWSKRKRDIAKTDTTFRLPYVQDITRNAASSMKAEEFSRYVEHVKTEEKF